MDIQNISATSIVALFETTKIERETFVTMIVESMNEGNVEPLQIHLQVKCMEDICKKLNENKEYKSLVLSDAEKHGKKFKYQNSEISIREVGTKYDYTNCNDNILNDLLAKQSEIDEQVKQRQKMLQALPISGVVITDQETGEVAHIYPPSKSSSTSTIVTLK